MSRRFTLYFITSMASTKPFREPNIGAGDQIKARIGKWETRWSVLTDHDLLKPRLGKLTKAGLCLGQHILTAINPNELGCRKPLMQTVEQDSRSTCDIQELWSTVVLLCQLRDSLNQEQGQRF